MSIPLTPSARDAGQQAFQHKGGAYNHLQAVLLPFRKKLDEADSLERLVGCVEGACLGLAMGGENRTDRMVVRTSLEAYLEAVCQDLGVKNPLKQSVSAACSVG